MLNLKYNYININFITSINVVITLMLLVHRALLYPLAGGHALAYFFLSVYVIVSFTLLTKVQRTGYIKLEDLFVSLFLTSLLIGTFLLARPLIIQFLNLLCANVSSELKNCIPLLLDLLGSLSIITILYNQPVPIGIEAEAINFLGIPKGMAASQGTKSSYFANSSNSEGKTGNTVNSPIVIDDSSRESSPASSRSHKEGGVSGSTSRVSVNSDTHADRLLYAIDPHWTSITKQVAVASGTASISPSNTTTVATNTTTTSPPIGLIAPSSVSNIASVPLGNSLNEGTVTNAGPASNSAFATPVAAQPSLNHPPLYNPHVYQPHVYHPHVYQSYSHMLHINPRTGYPIGATRSNIGPVSSSHIQNPFSAAN